MPRSSHPTLLPPKQPRSRKTLERIVRAGLAILEEHGPPGVTVQAVVARARSSVGSFYARFGGKEDLLAYLRVHVRESALAEWNETILSKAWTASTLQEVVAESIDLLLDVRSRWAAKLKAIEGLGSGEADYEAFRRRAVERLASRLLEHGNEIAHPRPDIAVRLGLWGVLGAIDHGRTGDAEVDPTPEVLRHECAELLLGYLVGGARGPGKVDFFDVWS